MGSNWDEIKRLAADFQKVQLTSTLQKLSERNCIEIVTLLLENKLVDVVFTNDGKEYITPEHLEREIKDELCVNGGRINLVEVSKVLNVDLTRIVDVAARIDSENTNIHFMLGQLINEDYITLIAHEINEKLAQKGEISVSDLTSQFDLPSDFLLRDVMEMHLGKIIRGRQDSSNPRVFFTQAYIHRCKAKMRGALAAITWPTNVSAILQQINVQEKIFLSLLEEMSPAGLVTSKMANSQYVPHIYAKMQSDWVNSFYKQNGFLEYEAVSKLGISEPKQFIRKQFPNEEMMFLKHCALGSIITDLTVLTSLNECHATNSYVDLTSILPSNISVEDIEEVFNTAMAQKTSAPNNFLFLDGVVFSRQFLNNLIQPCVELAQANAKTAIEIGVYQQHLAEKQYAQKAATGSYDQEEYTRQEKRDDRRKKAAFGKAGGGSQGRETKTKSIKKSQRSSRGTAVPTGDDDGKRSGGIRKKEVSLELVTVDDIESRITNKLEEEGLEHLVNHVAKLYYSQLNQEAIAKARELFEATPQTNRRQTHAAIQEKLNTLLVDLRLYEKGLKLFPVDVQNQLVKYLLKSLGNDICSELAAYVANECNLSLKLANLNVDQRNKIAQECDPEYKSALLEQNKALNKTVDDFVVATEVVLKTCSMIIKKADKRKDRQLIVQHKERLIQHLRGTSEPALVLHLSCLILFTTITGCILHASGKFVVQILSYIRPNIGIEQNQLLMQYHDLVLKQLQTDDTNDDTINELLQRMQEKIKEFSIIFEKTGVLKD